MNSDPFELTKYDPSINTIDVDNLTLYYENKIAEKATDFWWHENMINMKHSVYLITWNPDPKHLPDADFETQNQFYLDWLSSYLKHCYAGLFTVEATQRGNPHYHGWYQTSYDFRDEMERLALIKCMQQRGRVDIAKIQKQHTVRPGQWYEKANALWYYKKDQLDKHLNMEIITSESESSINFSNLDYQFFLSNRSVKGSETIATMKSDQQFYRDFYRDSLKAFNSFNS